MSPKLRTLLDKIIKEIEGQFMPRTKDVVKYAIATQIHAAREARERIEREGSVVRDPRGSVIAHPAIKIESDAIKMYTDLINKKPPKPY